MSTSPEFYAVWKYRVKAGRVADFSRTYQAGGTWATLFAQSQNYISTILLQDSGDPMNFLTIDRWTSRGAYEAFRETFGEAYARLDKLSEEFTEREELVFEGEALPPLRPDLGTNDGF